MASEKDQSFLEEVENFYKEIGGLVGYRQMVLKLLAEKGKEEPLKIEKPVAVQLESSWSLEGLRTLPLMAEVFVVGGAADRLGLFDQESGEPMPAACLEFAGKTLMQRLFEDLEARELLYSNIFKKEIHIPLDIPLVIMTSQEVHNDMRIRALLLKNNWFGRDPKKIKIFSQPLAPVMDLEGNWARNEKGDLLKRPGGHGVMWKCMEKEGIFDWLKNLGAKKMLLRQINNPVAGVDFGLLSFTGYGCMHDKAFGFSSCPRILGANEGMNALVWKEDKVALTNVEYGKELLKSCSDYPCNTNILFADIDAVLKALKKMPFPGLLVNAKPLTMGGEPLVRLESTMQNIADVMTASHVDQLDTYLTWNKRRKTLSATKQKGSGKEDLDTPERCLLDMRENARELLLEQCHFSSVAEEFSFHYNPKLGPLYTIIGQKIRGGSIGSHARVEIESDCIDFENIEVRGSLVVKGEGAITLKNCSFDGDIEIVVLKGSVFSAQGEHFSGRRSILVENKAKESWHWDYLLKGEDIILEKKYDVKK